jgi:hypothetical protein
LSFFEDFAITPFLTECFDHFVIAQILLVKADTISSKEMGYKSIVVGGKGENVVQLASFLITARQRSVAP